ncbi:MAG: hypothetical protein H9W81_01035 [Enterococcus sp.]|nr:hypothetical protein [Enterococcus sp.]
MSLLKTKSETLAKEFSLEGLRDYLASQIDVESYSDVAFNEVYEEFLFQLSLRVRRTADELNICGVNFFWAVYMEDAVIDPEEAARNYSFTAPTGVFEGVNAIIASIVYDLDIDALTQNYWMVKNYTN